MINVGDGTVNFTSPMIDIGRHTERDAFLTSPLFAISKPLNQNAPWSRYSFGPVTSDGELFAGDICFYSGVVNTISLGSVRPEFGITWNDFSLEKERGRHS